MKKKKNFLKIGVMTDEDYAQKNIDIITGRYIPTDNEPNIWFNSLRSLAEVLNESNIKLLNLIEEKQPQSITELAELSGRKNSNLSRTLKTFARYGIVELKKQNKLVRPIAKATNFEIHYSCKNVK